MAVDQVTLSTRFDYLHSYLQGQLRTKHTSFTERLLFVNREMPRERAISLAGALLYRRVMAELHRLNAMSRMTVYYKSVCNVLTEVENRGGSQAIMVELTALAKSQEIDQLAWDLEDGKIQINYPPGMEVVAH